VLSLGLSFGVGVINPSRSCSNLQKNVYMLAYDSSGKLKLSVRIKEQ